MFCGVRRGACSRHLNASGFRRPTGAVRILASFLRQPADEPRLTSFHSRINSMSDHHGGGATKPAKSYVFAAIWGLLPRTEQLAARFASKGTEMTNAPHAADEHHDAGPDLHAADEHKPEAFHPPYYMVLPFCLLLAAIAIFPLMPSMSHWWEHNSTSS